MTTDIKKYEFKGGLPHEFEIVNLSNIYRHPIELIGKPHRTNFYGIIWFTKGSPTHQVDFTPIDITTDTLLFIGKDAVQSFDTKKKFEGIALLFTDNFFCTTPQNTTFLRTTVLFNDFFSTSKIQLQKSNTAFNNILTLMQSELNTSKDSFQADILRNHLSSFLFLAERERRQQNFIEIKKGADLDLVVLFRESLEQKFTINRQVGFYAKQLLITEKRLNQSTSKILGKSAKEVIDDRIILEAKRLLAHSSESAKEISYLLGFEEPTYFIQFFKKHVAQTPVEFREKHMMA